MSIPELMTLTRKPWTKYLPKKMQGLRASGELNEALHGAANLAQTEIELLKKLGYAEHEACRAPPSLIFLRPEHHQDDQDRELAAMEAEYQKYPPVLRDE
jgi:hypothetical protein